MSCGNISSDMLWNDYGENLSFSLYLYSRDTGFIYKVSEGTGDNLLDEDKEAGYRDYWDTELVNVDSGSQQGGMWLEKDYISTLDYTLNSLVTKMCVNDDIAVSDWFILDPEFGMDLYFTAEDVIYGNGDKSAYEEVLNRLDDNVAGRLSVDFMDVHVVSGEYHGVVSIECPDGEERHYFMKTGFSSEDAVNFLISSTNVYNDFVHIGDRINAAECAEFEQSDKCTYSLNYNISGDHARLCIINGEQGAVIDNERTCDNTINKELDIKNLRKDVNITERGCFRNRGR